jgi:hypothetical protein
MRKYLASVLASLALVGCATSNNSRSVADYSSEPIAPQKASVNTLDLEQGKQEFTFQGYDLDELNIRNRTYRIVPVAETNTAQVEYGLNKTLIDKINVADGKLIPKDNCGEIRKENAWKVVPKDEEYFLVNVGIDSNNMLYVNASTNPAITRTIYKISNTSNSSNSSNSSDLVTKINNADLITDLETVKIGNNKYITMPHSIPNDWSNAIRQIFILEGSMPIEETVRSGAKSTSYKSLQGQAYIPFRGIEVSRPLPPEPVAPIVIYPIITGPEAISVDQPISY